MLKKPYEKIHKKGANNYYLLPLQDQVMYAIETVFKQKGWFGREKEFTMGLKMLPINSLVIKLFQDFLKLEVVEELELEGAEEKELIYETLHVKETREALKELFKEVKQSKFKYTASIQNDTVRELVKEGYKIVAKETVGGHARQVWVAKSNKFGVLHISKVLLVGKAVNDQVAVMDTFVFNQEIVQAIMNKLEEETKND